MSDTTKTREDIVRRLQSIVDWIRYGAKDDDLDEITDCLADLELVRDDDRVRTAKGEL